MQPTVSPPEVLFTVGIIVFIAIGVLIATLIRLLIWCKLCSKAGYSWALGLLMLVPIADIILAFYLAFADWPVRRELRQLRPQGRGLPM